MSILLPLVQCFRHTFIRLHKGLPVPYKIKGILVAIFNKLGKEREVGRRFYVFMVLMTKVECYTVIIKDSRNAFCSGTVDFRSTLIRTSFGPYSLSLFVRRNVSCRCTTETLIFLNGNLLCR